MSKENDQKPEDEIQTTDPLIRDLLKGQAKNKNGVLTIDDDKTEKPTPFKMPRAPPHVYSCFVINRTNESIECDVHYDGRPEEDTFNEDIHVIIPANGEKFFPRKLFQPELPESYCRWVKIITHIRVKKKNGKILETDYPFDNVHQPIRNWEFHVRDEGDILSKPPTRPANILKYENLDEYER